MCDSNRRDLWYPEQWTMRGGRPSEGSLSSTIKTYLHLTLTPSPKHMQGRWQRTVLTKKSRFKFRATTIYRPQAFGRQEQESDISPSRSSAPGRWSHLPSAAGVSHSPPDSPIAEGGRCDQREVHVHQDTDKHWVTLLVSIKSTFALYTAEKEPCLSHGNKEG